jgi:ABC-type multidrug transport system ATPase subunit
MVAVAAGVGRRFGALTVLQGVDLEVAAGRVVGLIGPNGGGKSTLLMLLAGLIAPTEGSVTVDGVAADQLAEQRAGVVGLVTADPGLYPLLTGWENLAFFGGLYGLSDAEVRERAAPHLAALNLTGLERRVGAWSTGMRQKLSLVRALLLSPKLLLLDEPTANLDPVATDAVFRAVRAAADGGLAVVVATHDLHAAELLCDEVAVIRGGIVARRRYDGPRVPLPPSDLLQLYEVHDR